MNILIKSAKIIDVNSKYHNKNYDILIQDEVITHIDKIINPEKLNLKKENLVLFKQKNLHVSTGWFDLHVNFGEPGFEQKETLESGTNAAIKGGFTGVLVMPNNNPNIDNRSMVEYIKNITSDNIIDVIPAGNITKNQKGTNIVEMHDMNKAGCNVFTDDKNSLQKNELMKIAMLYSKDTNSTIMNFPIEKSLANDGKMNEGIVSTRLGIKGIPSISEEIMVDRDLNLCDYTNCKLHLSYLSTKKSVDKLHIAKQKGLNVTADVALHNLILTDDLVNNFDTRYKVLPPLRNPEDNNALIMGIINDTIDAISTDHCPITDEEKKIEFDNAAFGIIGLESAFGILVKNIVPKVSLSKLIQKISTNPRKISGLPLISVEEGQIANLTLFDPDKEWIFNDDDIKSKSNNTPFIGEKLKGKPIAIINNGKVANC